MEDRKAELLERIESDREVLLGFFRRFIRCRSPNPPGDTLPLLTSFPPSKDGDCLSSCRRCRTAA